MYGVAETITTKIVIVVAGKQVFLGDGGGGRGRWQRLSSPRTMKVMVVTVASLATLMSVVTVMVVMEMVMSVVVVVSFVVNIYLWYEGSGSDCGIGDRVMARVGVGTLRNVEAVVW